MVCSKDPAIAFPIFNPTVKQTIKPGPAVAAMPSKSLILNPAYYSLIAFLTMNSIFSTCALAASLWNNTTKLFMFVPLDSKQYLIKFFQFHQLFLEQLDAAVSSQLVSIPKKVRFFFTRRLPVYKYKIII